MEVQSKSRTAGHLRVIVQPRAKVAEVPLAEPRIDRVVEPYIVTLDLAGIEIRILVVDTNRETNRANSCVDEQLFFGRTRPRDISDQKMRNLFNPDRNAKASSGSHPDQ